MRCAVLKRIVPLLSDMPVEHSRQERTGQVARASHGVLMWTVLGGLAEFERTLIKARTGEGRERAKGRGVRFGRPLKFSPHQRREAIQK
jgi:DNA invertase Pin-like site-specific DNA recombinase